MSDSVKRRDFIKAVSVLGASFVVENGAHAHALSSGDDAGEIKNDYFTISFDARAGKFNIHRTNGTALVTEGVHSQFERW